MTRRISACGAAIAAVLLLGFSTAALAASKTGPSTAIRNDKGTAYFSITHTVGNTEFAAGNVTDKAFGASAMTFKLKITPGDSSTSVKINAKVVLYTASGSLAGIAKATVNNVASKSQTITGGKLMLTNGKGALKGDTLTATFTGTADLASNHLLFNYKGQLQS